MTQTARLARVLAATLLSLIVALGFAFASTEWAFARDLAMARISGWVAIVALCIGLSLTPLGPLRSLSAWRRSVGVCTALAATVHALLSLRGPLDGAWRAVLTWPYLQAGALAFGVLLLLLLTSFPRIVRALRVRDWKVLHRLVYAAALFVTVHLMLSPWGNVVLKGAVCTLLLMLLSYRIIRGTKSSLRP